MTYAGDTPLIGGKYLHSKNFYGGIGADIQEMFAVNEIGKRTRDLLHIHNALRLA